MYIMPNANVLPYQSAFPKLGQGVFVAAGASLIGRLSVGESTNIWFNTTIRADENHITIGKRTNIQDNSVVHITEGKYPTIIGDEVTIGHGAIIHACTLGDQCLIGMGAIILDGAVIPSRSLVAAGSVVPPGKTYPEGTLIMGSPAKAVRDLSPAELAYFVESAEHYVQMAKRYMPPA